MKKDEKFVCPWWMGYFLLFPMRRVVHPAGKILEPYVAPGMKVMDYGSAMGYFTLPMASMVGESGKVFAVDLQEKMLHTLLRRAKRASLSQRIEGLLVGKNFNIAEYREQLDFVLLFAVVHEVPDAARLFREISSMLKPGGKILFAEPKGHVSRNTFDLSILLAGEAGLKVADNLRISQSHSVLLYKNGSRG